MNRVKKINPRALRGRGGGDSTPDPVTPTEAPDNLQSSANAQICDLICEGEIEGLVNGLQSIFLDQTPLQNDDGTFNFTDVAVQERTGTQDQAYMPIGEPTKEDVLAGTAFQGFNDVENEIDVGAFFKTTIPLVRTITAPDVTAVRVLISIPQLSYSNPSNGDLGGAEVSYRISVQSNGGGYSQKVLDSVNGKTMSKYQRSYRIQLNGGGPYDIKVERITADSTDANLQNQTYWESYTEVVEAKLTYPNSALIALRVKASQFSSVPARAYDVKLLKIQIPTNYDPIARSYTGIWDGTFKVAWTDNPAWVFYDLLTNTRYGLGNFVPADQVDKWTLYQIAKYCDELVPDGFGGQEPRFTCNLYLQTRNEAFQVVNDLASIFRGMPFWSSGSITVAQDSPQDASYLFTPANVVDGLFNYVGVSAKSRHTAALVTWNDPSNFYQQAVEYVEDSEGIQAFGVVEAQITAIGCTSRGQAHRLGRWTLYTEKFQSETVTFQTGLEGAICRPGQVIKIADPVRAGIRCGGRISASDTGSITVDADIPFAFDQNLSLSVIMPDGTIVDQIPSSFNGRQILVAGTYSTPPQVESVWLLSNAQVNPQFFRVVTVAESSPGVFDVTAVAHNPDKYDAVDNDTQLTSNSTSLLTEAPDTPTDLQVIETLYAVGKDVRVKVTLTWKGVDHAASYLVQWKRDNQNTVSAPQSTAPDFEILAAEPGVYQFWVYAISAVGKRSVAAVVTQTILGKGAPPESVQNFSLIPQAGMAYLTWDAALDLDVLIGGSVRIRYSPEIIAPVWKNSVDIMAALPGTATSASAPLLSGSYMAKYVDSSGIPSDVEAIIVTTIPDALLLNVVQTLTEDPSFSGTKTAMEFRTDLEGLTLSSTTLIDDLLDIDSIPAFDFLGGVSPSGEYDFANACDLGDVYTSNLTVGIAATSYDVTDTIDQRLDNCDDWLDLDGDFIDDVNAVVYMRSTSDDPGASPTWSDWKPFFVGAYTARAFQFKVLAESASPSHSIVITSLSVTIDMPDRTIDIEGTVSGIATYSVAFEAPFHAVPSLGIVAHNMISGDYYVIANKTNSGFDITFKNAANATVSRTFDVIAKGYGRAS